MWPTTAQCKSKDGEALELHLFSQGGGVVAEYEDVVSRQRLFATKSTIQSWKINADGFLPSEMNQKSSLADSDVETYLSRACESHQQNCTQLFVVGKRNSRAPLQISANSFASFAEKIDAFPSLAKALSAFESDGSDRYIALSGAFFGPSFRTPSLETCLLLGYVERSKQKPPSVSNPDDEDFREVQTWSLRQMAIYQKMQSIRHFETTMLVYPSSDVCSAVHHAFQDSHTKTSPYEHWTVMLSVVLGNITSNWPAMLAALHKAVESLKSDASFTDPKLKRISDVNVETLEKCTNLADKLRSACHVLDNNLLVLQALLVETARRREQDGASAALRYAAFQSGLESVVRELQIHRNHSGFLTGRLEHTTAQVRDLVALRNSYTMEKMTIRSISEARAVRLIALVTLFFLPPTFTCSFLQMGYIKVSSRSGQLDVLGEAGLLFYLAITLPLMALTVGGWLYWDWHRLREAKKYEDDHESLEKQGIYSR